MKHLYQEGPWRAVKEWLEKNVPDAKTLNPDAKHFKNDPKANALRIPAMTGMSIIYYGFVGELMKYGVFVKAKKLVFKKKAGNINRMNAYIQKQISRLKRLAASGQAHRFWRLWLLLTSKSVAFGLLALHQVIPLWYKELPETEVKKIMKEFNRIRGGLKTDYLVKEVEIPKPNGKKRTLSVPTKAWRLYLYLVNLGLHLYLNPKLNENQYGHRAGLGVMKCWGKILRNVNQWRNIFEFDFKAFHPTIKYEVIRKALNANAVPEEIIIWIMALNNPRVKSTSGEVKRRNVGVAQGVAFSALLGMLVLEWMKVYDLKGGTYIGFADDGIVGGNSPDLDKQLEAKLTPESGVEINHEKSGWVKRNGRWERPLKFLGAKFLGNLQIFKSNTRSGIDQRFEIGGIPKEGRLGTAKWWSEKFREYAVEHGISPYEVPENPRPLGWENALGMPGGMNTLMGTVWCGRAIQGSMDLEYVNNSVVANMIGKETGKSTLNIRNASSRAFEHLNGG